MTRLPDPPLPERRPDELCPLRPGDGCRACFPGATGPGDCGLLYLVSTDPQLCERLRAGRQPGLTGGPGVSRG